MKIIIYVIILSLFAACGKDNCQGTFYLSNSERAFLSYECANSFKVNYTSNSDNELNWISDYEAIHCNYDTVKEHDPMGVKLCADYYERWIIQIYPIDRSIKYESEESIWNIWLEISKVNNEFNTSIQFTIGGSPSNGVKNYSTFGGYPFVINGETIFFIDEKEIDGRTYENVYTMIDNEAHPLEEDTIKTYFDTLYYSTEYGIIKLNTERGSYTFENLD